MQKFPINLCAHDECTGCFACEGICKKQAIIRYIDDEGFSYPKIDKEKCISCHACENVCPVLNPIEKNALGDVYASWINDLDIRKKSSSGGLFSAFAIQVLKDGGAVIGAELQDDNYVRHILITSIEDLQKLRGSKYVQSNIDGNLYNQTVEYLKKDKTVLFCGTPCQVAGFKSLFKRYSDHIITIDLVCHGVPSPLFFAKLLFEIKKKMPNIVSYNFRDTENWLVCTNVNVNVNVNGTIVKRRLFGKYTFYQDAFMKGYLHRKNCYNCNYCTKERIGDITLADFWGIGTKSPFIGDYTNGCSLLSVNSDTGKKIFETIKHAISYQKRDIQESIDGGNEQLERPSVRPLERDYFYRDAFSLSYGKLISKYKLELKQDPNNLMFKIRCKIRKLKRNLGL